MKQYSAHLRERLLGAIDAGLPHAEAARLFGVGLSTFTRWRQRRHQTGSVTASARPGRRRRIGREAEETLVAQVQAAPDATLAEHCAAWGRRPAWTSAWPRCRPRCGGRGGRSKKSLIATERDDAARAAWRLTASTLNPADLVFVDETNTHTALTRRRARAPRGQRAVGRTPRNHGPNMTLLAALTPAGIGPTVTIPGAVDGPAFIAYAERVLAPSLRPGQVVVLDNLSAHKSADAYTAIGCRLLFLPASSPDFNPIELACAKVKERLHAAAERTPDGLFTATSLAIDAVSAVDARGFYAHCGFPSRPSTMRTALCVAQRSSGGLVAIARTLPMIAPRHWLLARGLLAVVVGLSASAPGLLPSQELGDLGASAANDRVITARRSMATAGWRRGNLGGARMTTTPRSRSARSRLRLHGPGPEGGRTPPASRMLCGICLLSAYPRVAVADTQSLSANEPRRDAPGLSASSAGWSPQSTPTPSACRPLATPLPQASPVEAGVG